MLDQSQCAYIPLSNQNNGISFLNSTKDEKKGRPSQCQRTLKFQGSPTKSIITNRTTGLNPETQIIIESYAKENSRLVGERQALFQKNCQLVNEIKKMRQKYKELISDKSTKKLHIFSEQNRNNPQQTGFFDYQQQLIEQQRSRNKINSKKSPATKKLNKKIIFIQSTKDKTKDYVENKPQEITKISFNDAVGETQLSDMYTESSRKSIMNNQKNLMEYRVQNKDKNFNLFSERLQQKCQTLQYQTDYAKKISYSHRKTDKHPLKLKSNQDSCERRKNGHYLIPADYIKTKKCNYPSKDKIQNYQLIESQQQQQNIEDLKQKMTYHTTYNLKNKHNQFYMQSACELSSSPQKKRFFPKQSMSRKNKQKNQQNFTNLRKREYQISKKNNYQQQDRYISKMHMSNIGCFNVNPDKRVPKSNIKQLEDKIQKIRNQNIRLRNNNYFH